MSLYLVLNLIITGIPSILFGDIQSWNDDRFCFKPYYNWNTFNTYIRVDKRL